MLLQGVLVLTNWGAAMLYIEYLKAEMFGEDIDLN